MHPSKDGEPLGVVAPKVGVEAFIGVYTEVLADDLDGQHFRIGELRIGAALAQLIPFKPVVHQAKNGHDKGALRSAVEDLLFTLGWLLRHHQGWGRSLFNSSEKLAHRVS